jgi:hypothetical protein
LGVTTSAADFKQVPVVRLEAQVEITAPPAQIWTWMIQGKHLAEWGGIWKAPANSGADLASVGQVLDFTDEYGNSGRSLVTFAAKDQELRIVLEPDNASYFCQVKFLLSPTRAGSQVRYLDQYTDESSPKDLQATADKALQEMQKTLQDLKRGVEKK